MNLYIYDIEVYAFDWLVVIRRVDSDRHLVIHNNNYQLKSWIAAHSDDVLGGFNNKHYDDWIVMTMLEGGDPETVKAHNDFIIVQNGNGWEFPFVQFKRKAFRSFDLKDDLPKGLSLKAIEGNMYLPIVESSIPFDIDRPLTESELAEVILYCKNDVDATLALYERRKQYIASKITVAELKGLDPAVALAQTNAKLAAMYLDAKPVERVDGRSYEIPANLDQTVIPREVIDFFRQINNLDIPDAELFETNLVYQIGGCDCVFAWGGVHGAIRNIIVESDPPNAKDRRIIVNYDVASLYPNSMLNFGYVSRSCDQATAYRDLVATRIAAKKAGNKAVANALKLVINTTYGAMLNDFNPLHDEKCGRSVCISNQLAMCELVCRLERAVPSFEILNFNTDGVMFRVIEREMTLADPILDEWQHRTGFALERDDVRRLVQKDVNNYLAEEGEKKIKAVGDYVKRWRGDDVTDENDIRARLINNDLTIVQIAIVERLLHDVPVETTINACTNIHYFQQIAKFGASYSTAFHEVNGERVAVQKVNRVYAVKDERFGTVRKVRPNGSAEKIASLPDHCVLDNENRLTVDQIDRQFYINLATERVNQYLVGKRGKTKGVKSMATTEKAKAETVKQPEIDVRTLNVYQKLMLARKDFLAANIKKSGVNRFADFMYFELADIVPVATEIFTKYGLVYVVTFDEACVIGALVNVDAPEETIRIHSPNRTLDYAKIKGMNALQGLGSEQTYQRRYLYMAILDIVENDSFDAALGNESKASANAAQGSEVGSGASEIAKANKKSSARPAAQSEREAVKDELTDVNGNADVNQVNGIVRALKKLREKDPNQYEVFIGECSARIPTKKNPERKISKKDADDMLIEIGKKIEE